MNSESTTYSPIFRIMHWAIAICFILLLITIFLRLNWMNKNHVAEIIGSYLTTSTDQSLTDEQLILLAKKIRKPMWDWHVYIGYALVGLFSIRLFLPFVGQMKFMNPLQKNISSKERFQYWIYIVFYVFVAISLVTGLLIEFGPKTWKYTTEEIHKLSIYYLLTYVVLHLGGVFIAEFSTQKGIISKIISGNKK